MHVTRVTLIARAHPPVDMLAPVLATPRADAILPARPVKPSKPRRKYKLPIVEFRRGEFKNNPLPPPWVTSWTTTGQSLGITDEPERMIVADAMDSVVISATVKPVAGGFFVSGALKGSVCAPCDCCGVPCGTPLNHLGAAGFELWLDDRATEDGFSGGMEVMPFPRSQESIDIPSLVRDTIRNLLPLEKCCDECDDGECGATFALVGDEVEGGVRRKGGATEAVRAAMRAARPSP